VQFPLLEVSFNELNRIIKIIIIKKKITIIIIKTMETIKP